MKNTAVSNVNSYLTQTAVKRQEAGAKKNAASLLGSFNQVLSDTTGKSAGNTVLKDKDVEAIKPPQPKEEQPADKPKTEQADQVQAQQKPEKNPESKEPADDIISAQQPDDKVNGETAGAEENAGVKDALEEAVQKVKDALEEAVQKVKDAIEEQFGVTEEELLQAMEMLGLKPEDLLIAARVNELAAALTGNQDALQLITDGELYNHLKAVLDVVSEVTDGIQEQFGLSDEQFQAMLEQAVNADGEQMPSGIGQDGAGVVTERTAETVNGPVVEVVNTTGDSRKVVSRQAQNPENSGAAVENVPDENTGTLNPVRRTHQGETAGRETGQENQNAFAGGGTMQQNLFQNSIPVDNRMAEQPLPQFADTQEIMNQIAERIRIVVSPEVSEMELQLKPESLGNLHLQIAVKNGAMTAQFTAENEAVKHVLETQMVQLRENLNNQGIRVEAVEVAVASHEFERNLQQDGRRGGAQENEPEERHRIRGLNLDEIGELDEADLTEEERLTAEMMLQNGNTVDYIA